MAYFEKAKEDKKLKGLGRWEWIQEKLGGGKYDQNILYEIIKELIKHTFL